MVSINIDLVLFLNIFYVSDCARRITGGEVVSTDKSYAVYLLKASVSDKKYDAWVCGGAIVSPEFIITSAACVDDVEYMYAIAGYNKYVKDTEIESNPCTKEKKKKIVYTCVPQKYELDYDKLQKWSHIDIALVKVESAYDFGDESYKTLCSYIPSAIPINYEERFQQPGTHGLVLGWGHALKWRQPNDKKNYNEAQLRYASTKIMDKKLCKQHYAKFENMGNVIDQYMICTLEKGELDEYGKIVDSPTKLDGCKGELKLLRYDNEPCDDDPILRKVLRSNPTKDSNINKTNSVIETKNNTLVNQTKASRKSGICQNDHGGPLVTWVGAKEVLIGVASVFRVSKDSKCMGPYLYTSTQCNGAFIDCLLSKTIDENRRALCDSPPIQRGYDTIERHISWKNHPAGTADNELVNEKFVVDRLNTKAGLSKELDSIMELGKFSENEMIAMRPQRPLFE